MENEIYTEENLSKSTLPKDLLTESLAIIDNMEKLDNGLLEEDPNAERPPIGEWLEKRGYKLVEVDGPNGEITMRIEKA